MSSFAAPPRSNVLVIHWLGHGYLATNAPFFEIDKQKHIVRLFTGHVSFTSAYREAVGY